MRYLKRLIPSKIKQLIRKQTNELAEDRINDFYATDTPSPQTAVDIFKDEDRINDFYVTDTPSPQAAVDIFKDEWSSQLPSSINGVRAGKIELFDDFRINWLISELGDFKGKRLLDLGPLEGGHSYMLERNNATEVIAVESNTHAYLKCLIAKELLEMQRVKFLCGDFVEYLKDPQCPRFDIGIACGVLYHMVNPVELISLLSQKCSSHIFIWTHYFDNTWYSEKELKGKFPLPPQPLIVDGFSHTLIRQYYGYEGNQALGWQGFCGGSRPYSHWMYRDELIQCLNFFGFTDIKINFDNPDHPGGPAFALIAGRAV